MNNSEKIRLLIEIRTVVDRLSSESDLSEKEQNLLTIGNATFDMLKEYIDVYQSISNDASELPEIQEFIPEPTPPTPPVRNERRDTRGENEGLAMVTGMAIAGILPVIPSQHHCVDFHMEQNQIEEFHHMFANLDSDFDLG